MSMSPLFQVIATFIISSIVVQSYAMEQLGKLIIQKNCEF